MPETEEIERRDCAIVELRVNSEGDTRQISGYAAVFDKLSEPIAGMFREQLTAGSFSKALRGKPDVLALWNHDANYPLARSTAKTLTMAEDDRGLKVDITPPDTQWANDLMVSMKRGDVHQMSFAFTVAPKGETWAEGRDGMQVRTITEVAKLYDVSVVSRPAYPQTTAAVRSLLAARGITLDLDPHAPAARLADLLEGWPDMDESEIRAAIAILTGRLPPAEESPPAEPAPKHRLALARRRSETQRKLYAKYGI